MSAFGKKCMKNTSSFQTFSSTIRAVKSKQRLIGNVRLNLFENFPQHDSANILCSNYFVTLLCFECLMRSASQRLATKFQSHYAVAATLIRFSSMNLRFFLFRMLTRNYRAFSFRIIPTSWQIIGILCYQYDTTQT